MPRVPIAVNLESRDGLTNKDAHSKNCTIEITNPNSGAKNIRKRPGCSDYGLVKTGLAQLLFYWNGIKAVIGDFFCSGIDSPADDIPTTWNPADMGAGITLSGSNLVAEMGAGSAMVRSVLSCTSGSWQFEMTPLINAGTGTYYIGLANSTEVLSTVPGYTNAGVSYRSNGAIFKSRVVVASGLATYTTGDVIGVVYDFNMNTISWYKNGVFIYQATNANVPTGPLFASAGFDVNVASSLQVTADFTSPFAFPIDLITTTNLSPTTASLPFSAQTNGDNAGQDYLMFKNATQAWTLTPSGVPTLITDADYPGISTVNVTQITRSGTVATVQTPADTNFQVGSAVTIAGAVETDYNGTHTVTSVTASNVRPAVEIPITITRSGTTATATSTTQPHGFINGQVVPIQGANQSEYNGDKTITLISPTQFSFTVTVTGTDATSPAGGSPVIDPYQLNFTGTNTVGAPTVFACTYTNPADQGSLVNGQTFTVNALAMGVCTVSGASAGGFTLTSTGFGGASPGTFGLFGFPTSPTVSSITSSENLATVTTSAAHNYKTGKQLSISGATPIVYNGQITSGITVTGSTTFTYILPGISSTPATPATGVIIAGDPALITGSSFTFTVANSPTTPATGSITATGGRNTVPGIQYINGYFIVMDVNAVLYNSGIDKPAEWNALDYTTANNIPGAGMAVARSADFIIAFKEWSTEPYYDAKNATGSPLSPYESGRSLIGCANGWSVAQADGSLFWVAQVKENGRSVYAMRGVEQQKVSTPDVDRILNAATLTTVYAYALKLDGHALYVLTLVESNLTLIYDLFSKHWYLWSSYTLGSTIGGTITITRSGTTATYTSTIAHGVADGEPALISGCTQTEYNGIFQTRYVSAYSFMFEVSGSPATPATGAPVVKPYTESYFKFTQYADCAGLNLMLHESDGHLYEIDSSLARDAGIPINYLARSQRIDGNTSRKKTMSRITLIGDTVADIAMTRWSDDDYNTNRPYRIVDLAAQKSMVRQCGAFVERSIEVKHIGNTQPIWSEMELEIQ